MTVEVDVAAGLTALIAYYIGLYVGRRTRAQP
jgi:hypothetical protein